MSCLARERIYPGHGQWDVLVRRVAAGGVAGLQRYFEQPDKRDLPKGAGCTTNLIVGVVMPVFVDAEGHRLVPRTPVDGCHHPLGYPYGSAGRPVRWHVVSVRRTKLLVSAPALAAHCSMRYGNVVAEGEMRLRRGTPLFTRVPWRVNVCIYRTPADHIAVGDFVGGKRLGPSQTRRLVGALTGSPTSRRCAKQRTFAIISARPSQGGASVELGGCWRVAPGYRGRKPNTADPSVVRAILGR